jgi:hypothetical protein
VSVIGLIGVDAPVNAAFSEGAHAAPDATNPYRKDYDISSAVSPLYTAWAAGFSIRRAHEGFSRFRFRQAKRDGGGL